MKQNLDKSYDAMYTPRSTAAGTMQYTPMNSKTPDMRISRKDRISNLFGNSDKWNDRTIDLRQ